MPKSTSSTKCTKHSFPNSYPAKLSRSPLENITPFIRGPRPRSIGAIIAGFKSAVTKRINQIRQTPFNPVWQRNYYEHIIRNENELTLCQKYILENPLNYDKNHPDQIPGIPSGE